MKLKCERQEGIAMVEMAIVLPVLLLILFAIAEFGIAFAKYQVITNASGAGARAAALFRSGCTKPAMLSAAQSAAVKFAGPLISASELTPTLVGDCDTETISVTVGVAEPFPVLSSLTGSNRTLNLFQTSTEFNLNALTKNAGTSND